MIYAKKYKVKLFLHPLCFAIVMFLAVIICQLFLLKKVDIVYALPMFFMTIAVYQHDHIVDIDKIPEAVKSKKLAKLLRIAKFCEKAGLALMVISLLVATYLSNLTLIPYLAVFVFGWVWNKSIIPLGRNGIGKPRKIKEVPYVKSLIQSFMQTLGTAGVAIAGIQLFQPNIVYESIRLFLFTHLVFFINAVMFDLWDIVEDTKSGVPTIPVKLGLFNTKLFLMCLSQTLTLISESLIVGCISAAFQTLFIIYYGPKVSAISWALSELFVIASLLPLIFL